MTTTLESARYVLLGTRKRDGTMVNTPVWVGRGEATANGSSSYYIFSAGSAGKVKRLRNFRTASLTPCTVLGRPLGATTAAEAVLLTHPADIAIAHRALLRHYGWQMRALDFFSRLSGNYPKRVYIEVRPSHVDSAHTSR